jgi:glucokinase
VNAYNYATRKNIESGEDIARAAREGDEIAQRVFQRAGRALGAAIATMAMLNDIDTFVLFGSVVNAGDLLLNPARKAVPRYSYPTIASRIKIMVGELGNDAGILGAAWGAASG